jgi:hypothetical protein
MSLAAKHTKSQGPGVLAIDVSSRSIDDLPNTMAEFEAVTEFISLPAALWRTERLNREVARLLDVCYVPDIYSYVLFGPLGIRLAGRFLDPVPTVPATLEHRQIWQPQSGSSFEPIFGDDEGPLYIVGGSARRKPPADPADYEEVLVKGGWHGMTVILARHKRTLGWAASLNLIPSGYTRGLTVGPVTSTDEPGWVTLDVTTTQTVKGELRSLLVPDQRMTPAHVLDPHGELDNGFGAPFSSIRIDLGRLWPMAN